MTRAAKGRRVSAAVLGLAAVLLAAALPAPASASAPSPTYAETRVRGSSPQIAAGVGGERSLSQTSTEAYATRYDELAAGYPLVPRGTPLDELAQAGIKHSPEDVLRIARDPSGRVVFLESGNARAGLQHIVGRHAEDFARVGVSEAQIPDLLITATTRGRVVGTQGGRPIYEVAFGGQTRRVAVTVGDNGFIVGANPVGR